MSEIRIEEAHWPNGNLREKATLTNDVLSHGTREFWHENGKLIFKRYYLYNKLVTEEEYRRHELIENLSNINSEV